MSNRRRLASEKAKRVRCPRCHGRSFARKGRDRVCLTCEHITTDAAQD